MKLNNKVYDVMKWIVMIVLPALSAFYVALAAQYLRGQAATHQRTALRRAVRLDTLLSQLDGREFCEYTGMLDTPDGPRSKRFCCSWLDREAGILLLTLEAL